MSCHLRIHNSTFCAENLEKRSDVEISTNDTIKKIRNNLMFLNYVHLISLKCAYFLKNICVLRRNLMNDKNI